MKTIARRLVPALLVLSLAGALRAQDKPAPVPVGHVSVASVDTVTKLITDLGIPAPDDMIKSAEAQPFLGPDSVDTTKPAGIIILGGDSLPSIEGGGAAQAGIIAIPVKEGKVTPDTLKAAGGVALDDKPGIFKVSQYNVRRLGDYVLVELGSTQGLAELTEVPLANDYKTPGNIAVFTIDLAALRKAAPEGYKSFFANIDKNIPPGPAGEEAAAKFGTGLVLNPINKLEKFTLAIGQDDVNLHLKTWLTPLGPGGPAPAPVARPAFPKTVLAQIHVVYPTGDSADLFKTFIDSIPSDAFGGMDQAHLDKTRATLLRAAKLFGGGTGLSVAMAVKGGRPVFYLVPQFSTDVDFNAEVKAIIAAAKEIDPDDKGPEPEVTTYDAGSKKVTRITMPEDDGIIDCMGAGKTLYITISPHDGHYVQEIADAGLSSATSSLLCAGAINLGNIYDAASQMGTIPPDAPADLKKSLDGQSITWTAQGSAGNTLFVDVTIPKALVKSGVAAVGQLMTREAAPGAGTMPAGDAPMPPK